MSVIQRTNTTKNKATTFLLPLLNIPPPTLKGAGFINAYLKCEDSDWNDEEVIFLLFSSDNTNFMKLVLASLGEGIVEELDYEGYTIIVVKWPQQWRQEYLCFIEGKYSKFSEEAKKLFPQKPTEEERQLGRKMSLVHEVFSKAPRLREQLEERIGIAFTDDMELTSIPDIEKTETLYIKQFVK